MPPPPAGGHPRGRRCLSGGFEEMAEIKVGDLVSWQSGEKTKVGVVKAVAEDGTCTIDLSTRAGRFEEHIRASRLTRITSTIEPEPPQGTEGD